MTQDELTPREFQQFQEFIYTTSGIRVRDNKRTLLSNRVRRRLRAGGFAGFQTYYQYITSPAGRDELGGFLDAITTNETSFFRTEKHFEWFRSEFITELVRQARAGSRPKALRVWSAACSTGEEPYSLAICLAENKLRLRDWTLDVVGTDISEDALQAARTGAYRERTLEHVSESQCRRYFQKSKTDEVRQVRPEIRDMVSFHSHNLMKPLRLPSFDCVFIRNVLIYFDRDSKQTVIDNLVRSMTPGGYLVVGPSEGIYDMLGMLTKRSSFLYQKP